MLQDYIVTLRLKVQASSHREALDEAEQSLILGDYSIDDMDVELDEGDEL